MGWETMYGCFQIIRIWFMQGSAKEKACVWKFLPLGLPEKSGLDMHSQSANNGKSRLNSPNLAPFLLLNPVFEWRLHTPVNFGPDCTQKVPECAMHWRAGMRPGIYSSGRGFGVYYRRKTRRGGGHFPQFSAVRKIAIERQLKLTSPNAWIFSRC